MEQQSTNNHIKIILPVALIGIIKLGSLLGFGVSETPTPPNPQPAEITPDGGFSLRDLSQHELREYLTSLGFKNISKTSLHEMRRMFLAYYYDALLAEVNKKTHINKAVLFAYLIIEGTKEGIETPLLRNHWNPGGIKYKGVGSKTYQYDDCFSNGRPVPCEFESVTTFNEAVNLWTDVFNNKRYTDCKNKPAAQTCQCLQEAGYHSANSWRIRFNIAKQYIRFTSENLP